MTSIYLEQPWNETIRGAWLRVFPRSEIRPVFLHHREDASNAEGGLFLAVKIVGEESFALMVATSGQLASGDPQFLATCLEMYDDFVSATGGVDVDVRWQLRTNGWERVEGRPEQTLT